MAYVAVTVTHGRDRFDLALPLEATVRAVASGIASIMKAKGVSGRGLRLALQTPQGVRNLPANATLFEVGVLHGAQLVLVEEELSSQLPHSVAFLLAADGQTFPLGKRSQIGRCDPEHDIFPDVDLKPLDARKIASRRHACIEYRHQQYLLTDLGSKHGTWVNMTRLSPNQPHPLADGDEITFGKNGVRLTFRLGGRTY